MSRTKIKSENSSGLSSLDLPPGFHARGFRELKDAFIEAQRLAGDEGGGLVTFIHRFDTVEFALVIEPDEPLCSARRAVYAAMNALADIIAAYCPPERAITFGWPDTIKLDQGVIGGVRLAAPKGTGEEEVPDWLVIGLMVRLFVPIAGEAQHEFDTVFTEGTSLATEGFEMLDGGVMIEGFCRHLLYYFDQWQERGFLPVGQNYLERLEKKVGAARLTRYSIDGSGNLVASDGRVLDLRRALEQPGWLDGQMSAPRL